MPFPVCADVFLQQLAQLLRLSSRGGIIAKVRSVRRGERGREEEEEGEEEEEYEEAEEEGEAEEERRRGRRRRRTKSQP